MTERERYLAEARAAGCPQEQMANFLRAGLLLQPRQLAASAAARFCDRADGPTSIGFGGARGGGKSHWLLAQMGADDCQRVPGLKCLLLRKVGKANMEHFGDLRRRLFAKLPHDFSTYRGIVTFGNGSRIIAGHFQSEGDIDAYLGLEYDVVGIEEATTLTARKYQDITTCCRTSKPNWRPRIYSTTNPGGVGHCWYRTRFVLPFLEKRETETRFIPARVTDNHWNKPEYTRVLQGLSTRAKGYQDMIEAFRLLQQMETRPKLVMVGSGTTVNTIKDQIEDSNLKQSVILTGEREDVHQLLALSDVYASSSHGEGLPLAVLEAMMAGLPVVATSVGDIPNVVTEETGVVVPPHHPELLAAALEDLLNNPKKRQAMGQAAYRRAMSGYSVDAWMKKHLALYREVLSSNGHGKSK